MIEQLIQPDSVHVFLLSALALFLVLNGDAAGNKFLTVFLVLTVVWSLIASIPVVKNKLLKNLEAQYSLPEISTQNNDNRSPVIVVLTSGYTLYRNDAFVPRLDESGWERIHGAVALWKRLGGTLLVSGNNQELSMMGLSMAEAMAQVAIDMGVPAGAVQTESQSRNTLDSIKEVSRLYSAADKQLWLVTSAYHMPRAMLAAKELSVDMIPYPTDFKAEQFMRPRAWFPDFGTDISVVTHEYIGLVYYKLKLL